MDICAPAITAPEGSVMVPFNVAPETWALAWAVKRWTMAKIAMTETRAETFRRTMLHGMMTS
jgi:hypothetical protein